MKNTTDLTSDIREKITSEYRRQRRPLWEEYERQQPLITRALQAIERAIR